MQNLIIVCKRERERMMTSPVAAKDDKSLQKLSLLQSKKGDASCIFNVEAILSFQVSTSQTMISGDNLSRSQSQLELLWCRRSLHRMGKCYG